MISKALTCFALILLFCGIVKSQSPQTPVLSNTTEIPDISVKSDSMTQLLSKLAFSKGLVIGYEAVDSKGKQCRLQQEVSLEYRSVSVQKLFDQIMKSAFNCDWQLEHGTVVVFPRKSRDRITDITFEEVWAAKGTSRFELKRLLSSAKEIKQWEEDHGKSLGYLIIGDLGLSPISKDFSLDAKEISLREVFILIAKSSKNRFWTVFSLSKSGDGYFFSF